MTGDVTRIPHFIAASNPKGLMAACLKLNLRDGVEYKYFAIQFDGKQWVAWFYKEIDIKSQISSKKIEESDGPQRIS